MIGNKLPNKGRRRRKKEEEKEEEGGIGDGEETLAAYSIASQRLMAHCRQMTDSYISDIDDGQRARRTGKSPARSSQLSWLRLFFFFFILFTLL